jgi:putative hydrolase of the HAD superfamily
MIQRADKNAVIVFDLDDTLYPECDFVASGFQAVDEELKRRNIHGFFPVASQLFQAGKRRTIFDAALAQLGVDANPKLIAELVEVYRSHAPRLQLFPDAQWALDRYGAKLGLLTDGISRTQRNKVRALGLDARFAAAVYTSDLGEGLGKPSPVPFQTIAAMLGMQTEMHRLVYVADNPKKDFIAPNQLGWLTIRIQRGTGEYSALEPVEQSHVAQCEIHTLEELAKIVNA